jgi:ketosteroid isomerase-like protein
VIDGSVEVVRQAYEAYVRGDVATMLEFVDADLEWTYLDPNLENPEPRVCHGRDELATVLERQAKRGLKSELEEVVGHNERVMVVIHTPGVDAHRVKQADDRNYDVLTVREGHIVTMRACRDRDEAATIAGVM